MKYINCKLFVITMLKYRDAVEIVEAVPTCPPSLTTCAYGSGRPAGPVKFELLFHWGVSAIIEE